MPKAFRFEGREVMIEKRGDEVVLKPVPTPKFKTMEEVAKFLAEKYPDAESFPDAPPRPKEHERPILEW